MWQGDRTSDRSQDTFHIDPSVREEAAPDHMAARTMLNLHHLQCEVDKRCDCPAGANALSLPKVCLNANVCSVNKTSGFRWISNLISGFQTVLWR